MDLALAQVAAEEVRRGAARVLAGLGLLEQPHASARTQRTPAGPGAGSAAAAAADPEWGGTSQGGLGPRRSIHKRTSPARVKVSKAESVALPGLAPAAASGGERSRRWWPCSVALPRRRS